MHVNQSKIESRREAIGVPIFESGEVPVTLDSITHSVRLRRPAFILLLAIACNAILAAKSPVKTEYGAEAGQIAASIAEGKGFSSPFGGKPGPTAWTPPLYPYLLAGIFRVFGVHTLASYRVATAFNIVVFAISCLLLYKVAGQVFGERVGFYSACALASLPLLSYPLVWLHLLPGNALGEAKSLFILPTNIRYGSLPGLFVLLLILYTLNPPHWSVYGITWAAGALVSPTILALAPAFVLYLLAQRKSWRYLGLMVCVAALCISPWLARNYLVFHRLIPIRDNFGVELRCGNQPGAKGLWDPAVHPHSSPYEFNRLTEMGEIEYNAAVQREALQIIRSHPAEFVANTIRRIGYWWMGTPAESQTLGRLWFLKNLPLAVFSALAFCGVVCALRTRNRSALLFIAELLFYPIAHYITHTQNLAYMYPIHPEMLALATAAIMRKV
jgi:Dolichyl-phosphate-mannose-protein mannosyltransferase